MGLSDFTNDQIMIGVGGLLRLFWPSDTPHTGKPGTVVGWRNSELDVFVVSVVQDIEVGSSWFKE